MAPLWGPREGKRLPGERNIELRAKVLWERIAALMIIYGEEGAVVIYTQGSTQSAAIIKTLWLLHRKDGAHRCKFGTVAFQKLVEQFEPPEGRMHLPVFAERSLEVEIVPAAGYLFLLQVGENFPNLLGLYISTANSAPALKALSDAGRLGKTAVIATDLYPELARHLESGGVLGTLYQRPHSQGQIAFRMLHDFLVKGQCPSYQVRLAPHLIMKSNLSFFLQRLGTDSGMKLNERDSRTHPDYPTSRSSRESELL